MKIYISFPKKDIRTVISKLIYTLIKIKRIAFFTHTHKKNLSYSFINREGITKTRFSPYNLVTNTTKWYNIQEDMKICKNGKRKKMENEIHIIILVAISMTTFEGKHSMK